MYLLEYKPEKVHASDEKSLKMNHATFALDSAATTPSSGKKTRWSDLAKLYFAMQKVSHNTHTVKAELQPAQRAVHSRL